VERASDRGYSIVQALVHLGRILTDQGDFGQALEVFKDGLATLREAGLAGATLSYSLDWLAVALARTGDPLRAALLFGAAESQWRASGVIRRPDGQPRRSCDTRWPKNPPTTHWPCSIAC
jgi:hypothetical protein